MRAIWRSWRFALLLCCATLSLCAGQRSARQEWMDLMEFIGDTKAKRAVAGRRLFSFGMPDVDGMVTSATQWVESTATSVSDKVMSLSGVSSIFSNSSTWVQRGLAVATEALTVMRDLGERMVSIFTQFSPLKPIFASEDGLTTLFTQPNSTARLVQVVRELFNTSSVLQTLNEVLHQVSGMFTELSTLFSNLLGKLGTGGGGSGRRLSSWMSLLEGIDFPAIVKTLQDYLKPLSDCTTTLLGVSDVLGPIVVKLDENMQSLTGGKTRRLLGVQDILDLKKNQEKYSSAISKIIPVWQAVEKLGVKMCPTVALSQTSAYSLKCRINSFVSNSVGLNVGAITGMVKNCGGEPTAQAPKASKDANCPTAAYSAGLQNLLGGSNSTSMGWILAIVAALGLFGIGGGAVAAKKMQQDDSGEEDDSGDDEYNERLVGERPAE